MCRRRKLTLILSVPPAVNPDPQGSLLPPSPASLLAILLLPFSATQPKASVGLSTDLRGARSSGGLRHPSWLSRPLFHTRRPGHPFTHTVAHHLWTGFRSDSHVTGEETKAQGA